MLVFVLPLMSKRAARDFRVNSARLEQTLRSICNQLLDRFMAIVVCHERPEIGFAHPNVVFCEVDFDMSGCIHNGTDSSTTALEVMRAKRTDKGRKMLYGYYQAQKYNPSHIMFLDADDLVSNRLAEVCVNNSTQHGWYVEKGYRHFLGSRWIYSKRMHFYKECGSAFIMRYDIVPVPPPAYDRDYPYYEFFLAHARVVEKLRALATPLVPLPFYGVVYVVHGSSLFATERFANEKFSITKVLKCVANLRPLSKRIMREFNLAPLSTVRRTTVLNSISEHAIDGIQ